MKLKMKRSLLLCLLLSATVALRAGTNAVVCQSAERQTALLELYTSEGCSSCPPAERWLSEQKDSPGLWKDFVPVAFHIDYWDHLGWRDPWSNPQSTQRQNAYAQVWRSESVYTPEFVLNGSEWRGGWTKRVLPALADVKVGVLTATLIGTNRWRVSFAPIKADTTGYEVNAALLESGVSSDVKAGENRGRKLAHDFAMVRMATATLSMHDGAWRGELTLPPQGQFSAGRAALAVWVSPPGQMQPLQATGCWLP